MDEGKTKLSDIFYRNAVHPDAESIFSFQPKSLEEIMKDCIVVLDTNSLLVPYMTGKESLDQIKSIYKSLAGAKRLIIPGQVAREFAVHRVTKLKEMFQQITRKKVTLSLGNYPMLEGMIEYQKAIEIEDHLRETIKEYNKKISDILSNISQFYWNDPVSKLYHELFAKDVILDIPLDKDRVQDRINKDVEYKLPPGYKDSNKLDDGVGDVLIWFSILNIGKERKKDVLFISLDQKSDWWVRSEGQPLYPRYELVDEFRQYSEGRSFHAINFSSFLNLFGASEKVVEEVAQEEIQVRIEQPIVDYKTLIILLSLKIRSESRRLLASLGLLDKSTDNFLNDLKLLQPFGVSVDESTHRFFQIRNQIAHSQLPVVEDWRKVVEIGQDILRNIQAIPHEINIIYKSAVPLYADFECKIIRNDVKGVILETRRQPGNAFVSHRIFPTTKDYRPGETVSWEWNLTNSWGESWYRDTDSQEIKYAWTSSGEFVGRKLDEIN